MTFHWHKEHVKTSTLGQRLADRFALAVGSWKFIIIQSSLLAVWIVFNIIAAVAHWDPYPFILLNLVLSFQAAFATPIIMMAQNRAAERDRHQANADYLTNVEAKKEIEQLIEKLDTIEIQKLDKILELLVFPGRRSKERRARNL